MREHERVLLLAHARSGSSNLYQILQSHSALEILEEPFNENFTSWSPDNKDYRSLVRDVVTLDATVQEIFERWNGLKVLDYQLTEDLLEHLVTRPDMLVVFIMRRNLLQTAVSALIAEQTSLWKIWDAERPVMSYYKALAPLDVESVRTRIQWLAQGQRLCHTLLDRRSDGRSWRIDYEDLYFAERDAQTGMLESLWGFLGLEPIGIEEVDYYLRPERTKLNSPATYTLVPNIEEVERACGSDEHGWLFGRGASGAAVQLGAAPDDQAP